MADDPWLLKLRRAQHHLQCLETEVQGWLDGDHHTVVTKRDRKRRGYWVVLASAEPVPYEPFGLLIGDALQNLRSGLDHVAYRLAERFTIPLPPDVAEESEFPIFGDMDRKGNSGVGQTLFQRAGLPKIRGADPRAQTIIESLQPYHRGNDFRTHPLWKLHELSRIDKHRLLHPVAYHFSGAMLDTRRSYNWRLGPGKITVHSGPIVRNTVIIRYPATPIEPRKEMHMHFEPAIGIAFPDGGPVASGGAVVDTLAELYNYVSQEVVPPLMPFL